MNFVVNGELKEAVNGIAKELDDLDLQAKNRAVTGVLASHPDSRDTHIMNLSITFHGAEMLVDTNLNLNVGCRYGLIGPNGCGKCCNMTRVTRKYTYSHTKRRMGAV